MTMVYKLHRNGTPRNTVATNVPPIVCLCCYYGLCHRETCGGNKHLESHLVICRRSNLFVAPESAYLPNLPHKFASPPPPAPPESIPRLLVAASCTISCKRRSFLNVSRQLSTCFRRCCGECLFSSIINALSTATTTHPCCRPPLPMLLLLR